MSSFSWFVAVFFAAQFIGLITTTNPTDAAENLRQWRRVLWRS